jgi:nicotinate-nucleotide adenylyltransferase
VTRRRILLLGGSFDPVHNGHVALGAYFIRLLHPDELRILPAGNPWQKQGLHAAAADRVEMARRAFERQPVEVIIDQREIRRDRPTYTIDTLREIRAEAGPRASLAFLLGADQLRQLDSWKEWRQLFDYAHLCAASRPGFAIDAHSLPPEVAAYFGRRHGTPEQIRNTPNGLAYLASNLAMDVSATDIRSLLGQGKRPQSLIPGGVLDYIEQHQLYKS